MAEYVWIDGAKPTAKLRSKTKILEGTVKKLEDIPEWGFDGSSTQQAVGDKSDCALVPVSFFPDPIRSGDNILVMCEVYKADGSVHPSNTRHHLVRMANTFKKEDSWFGIEQEYTLFDGIKPLGWPDSGLRAGKGGYYCGIGADEVFGRNVVENHMKACLYAGILISGINAEVMPAQWEFQVGPLGPLEVADQLWMARWLLYRIGENYGVNATLHPKPMRGWNGAGAHTNFSTKAMRAKGGLAVITKACEKLGKKHAEHIAVYGANNDERLMGKFEAPSINDFRYGISDRGASVRIPLATSKAGRGYLEDRRPAANMDPYQVCAKLLETVYR